MQEDYLSESNENLNIDFENNENIPAFFKALHHKSIKKGDSKAVVKKKESEMSKVKKENKVVPAAVPNKMEAEKNLHKVRLNFKLYDLKLKKKNIHN